MKGMGLVNVPQAVGKSPVLRELDLGINLTDIGALTAEGFPRSLTRLNLAVNAPSAVRQIVGYWAKRCLDLSELVSLEWLDVSQCRMSLSLIKLPASLQQFRANQNDFTLVQLGLAQLSELRVLELGGCTMNFWE